MGEFVKKPALGGLCLVCWVVRRLQDGVQVTRR